MLICINNKCVDFDETEEKHCKRKKKWKGCKKAELINFSDRHSFSSRVEGYHCASGSKAWGDEQYRKP